MRLSRVAIAAAFLVVAALIVIPMLTSSSSGSKNASSSTGPSHSPTAKAPTPTKTPKSPSGKPTRRPTTVPTPKPTAPIAVTVAAVRCPSRVAAVTVTDKTAAPVSYKILTNGALYAAGLVTRTAPNTSSVHLDEGRPTRISVTWNNQTVRAVNRTASCVNLPPSKSLPFTGPDRGLLIARIATGAAALLTGAIVFWYARLWPRRRDRMFD